MALTRVLHLVDKLTVGDANMHGVTRLLSWWVPRYDQSRFRVAIASLRARDRAGAHLESLGIRVFYLGRGKFDLRTLFDVVNLASRERIDLLHLHAYAASDFGRVASRILGLPCIVHEHMDAGQIPGYQRLADRLLARWTDRAIAVSRSVRRSMIEDRSIPEDRVEVIYNSAPLECFEESVAAPRGAASWRLALGIPADHTVVATVGRLHPIKGHSDFIAAAARLLQNTRAVTFVVVGDGELLEPLRRQAADLALGDAIRFLGHREDVAAILRGVDIKVIASHSEGIPLTLFEALAAGCAVVATRVGGVPEVLEDGVDSCLVPAGDPASLAAAIERLIDDPPLRRQIGLSGQARAKRFNLESAVRAHEALWIELISRARSGGHGR